MNSLDSEILALMRRVSKTAILPRYQRLSPGDIDEKGINDFVTIADRESEQMLAEALSRLEPSLAVVGEEAAHEDPAILDALQGPCWIIDPIDGTRNFASGSPPFGIMIARAEGGLARSGWIYDCLTERFCSAHLDEGAYIDGSRITAMPTGQTKPIAAISLVFASAERRKLLQEEIAPHYQLVDIPYCAAEQYPRLALGTNDVSVFERTLAWDHAAGVLWLNEASGKALRPDGSAYLVSETGRTGLLAASNERLWEQLASRLQESP